MATDPEIRRMDLMVKGKTEKVYVHHTNGKDFIPLDIILNLFSLYRHNIEEENFLLLDDVLTFLSTQSEVDRRIGENNSSTSNSISKNMHTTKEFTVDGKVVRAYVIDGDTYLTMTQVSELYGYSSSGISQRMSGVENKRKIELEEKWKEEIAQTGHSNIHPEEDSKLRKKFSFSTKHTFMRVEDAHKYFWSPKKD